ncbi:hypothetical protein [Sporosarcina sp. BP05]|uniref:hypothetical protein n=1 Tax=Sporosarcina sp. BP05 TaxID=2758726 RepID=UPI0016471041|nr:hypothetical protein [Sporosarcina sp. BP05]
MIKTSKMMKIIGAVAVIYLMIDTYGVSAIAYGTVISAAVNFVLLAIYERVKWAL